MSTQAAFVVSGITQRLRTENGATLTGLNVNGLFGVALRQRLEQGPGQNQAFAVGDGEETAQPVTLEWVRVAASSAAARNQLNEDLGYATTCSHVRIEMDGVQVFRNVLGISSAQVSPVGNQARAWRARVVFLPRFPRWIDTYTTTVSGYVSATKLFV